jgi:hypothetical protein
MTKEQIEKIGQHILHHPVALAHIDQPLVNELIELLKAQDDAVRASISAIGRVLNRIKVDEQIRYKMGAGSETFERLTKAESLITGRDVEEIRNYIIPGSADLHRER